MINGFVALILMILITGCAQGTHTNNQKIVAVTQVKYVTSPIGADIYELDTGKYLGISPLVVNYDLSNTKIFDGCRLIKGVSAKWKSGSANTPFPTNKLCGSYQYYTITIPYVGNEKQRTKDVELEPIFASALHVRDAIQPQLHTYPQQQVDNDAAMYIIGAALINSTATLVDAANTNYYIRPSQVSHPNHSVELEQRRIISAAGCYSDIDCGTGLSCVKPPLTSTGSCLQRVNEFGTPLPVLNNPGSVLPNTSITGQCTLNSECPIGFRCDMTLKACVK